MKNEKMMNDEEGEIHVIRGHRVSNFFFLDGGWNLINTNRFLLSWRFLIISSGINRALISQVMELDDPTTEKPQYHKYECEMCDSKRGESIEIGIALAL
jgi:hypothetical protein